MAIHDQLPHNPPVRRARWLGGRGARTEGHRQLRNAMQGLQQFFESSCGQFDEDEMSIAEWRQARDAFAQASDTFTATATVPTIESLFALTRRYVHMAVEISTARSYDDGRI